MESENEVKDDDMIVENIERAFVPVLTNEINRAVRYLGNSSRTQNRKKAMMKDAARGTKPLTGYCTLTPMFTEFGAEVDVDNENDADLDYGADEDEGTEWTKADISLAVENLKKINRKPNEKNNAAHAREAALLGYFRQLQIGKTKKAASSFISDAAGRGVYFSRSIRTWARTLMKDGTLPQSKQGKHAK